MTHDPGAVDRTIETLTGRLLACRTGGGHWEGRLASSALATATAVVALALDDRASARHGALIRSGLEWLAAHQNADGGWGDTVLSASNLSTTALCWAALDAYAPGRLKPAPTTTLECAERWLRAQVGDLDPASLRQAVLGRYGSDRTFSAPILTVLALAGKLGSGADAWRQVPQLPFELAVCPHRWFRWMRLPVVSYALPALVAIGQARHHHAPTRNPLWAAIRSALRPRTVHVARQMQPDSGGYLEAVPLTAFVVMSLIASGGRGESGAIIERGIAFLAASARPDGSWPIDTNLATWVTTRAVVALDVGRVRSAVGRVRSAKGAADPPDLNDLHRVRQWLLDQQVQQEHPFTHAQPGGWGWSNLSGAVPDADDTSGALLALRSLAGCDALDAATAGIDWLLAIQNRDGGIPTFCRGWGALPFDRSAPDLTAHALEAWNAWRAAVAPDLRRRIERAAQRAVAYLANQQRADGSWAPLWFGNQHVVGELNLTYGTSRVVTALATPLAQHASDAADRIGRRGLAWLLDAQRQDGGWGGAPESPGSIEETGVALGAIAAVAGRRLDGSRLTAGPAPRTAGSRLAAGPAPRTTTEALLRGSAWLIAETDEGRRTPASPIGLYFARLWYYEELYPLVMGLHGLAAARAALTATAPD